MVRLQTVTKSKSSIASSCNLKFFSFLLGLCLNVNHVKELHAKILVNGVFHQSVVLDAKLCNIYIELGSLENGHDTFDQMRFKNSHAWNTIISGYSKRELFTNVLSLYKRMRLENHRPDSYSLVFAIKACIGLSLLDEGKSIHFDAIKYGLESDSYVAPVLIKMFVKLGCLEDAQEVFNKVRKRNSVVCASMISGYLKHSKEEKIFELFSEMRMSGLNLDSFTVEGLIRACGNVGYLLEGEIFHGYCIKRNFTSSNSSLQSSIALMYGKCDLLDNASKVFDETPMRDVVLWNVMISGFEQNGRANEAIDIFRKMLKELVTPNKVVITTVAQACSKLGAIKIGKSLHAYLLRNEDDMDVITCTAFVDMYCKCGGLEFALRLFHKMPEKNVFSWTTIINGLGIHGKCTEAIDYFSQMRSDGVIPNSVTFVSLLSACVHSGSVEEGWNFFESMRRDYGIHPQEEHYACMINLLCRVGEIEKAASLIMKMSVDHRPTTVLGALLNGYSVHKQVNLAESLAKKLLLSDPYQSDVYVLLSNLYAQLGMWEMVNKVRDVMMRNGLQKTVGFSTSGH